MADKPDPLWDPDLPGDDELQRLTSLLGTYRHMPGCEGTQGLINGTRREKRDEMG